MIRKTIRIQVNGNEIEINTLNVTNIEGHQTKQFAITSIKEAQDYLSEQYKNEAYWNSLLVNDVPMYRYYAHLLDRSVPPDLPIYVNVSKMYIALYTYDRSPDHLTRRIVIGDVIKLLKTLEENNSNMYDFNTGNILFPGQVMEV